MKSLPRLFPLAVIALLVAEAAPAGRGAERTIADVDASGLWPGNVVTEVEPAGPFWEAEPEHQDYLQKFPYGYTCHFPRPGWRLPHRVA